MAFLLKTSAPSAACACYAPLRTRPLAPTPLCKTSPAVPSLAPQVGQHIDSCQPHLSPAQNFSPRHVWPAAAAGKPPRSSPAKYADCLTYGQCQHAIPPSTKTPPPPGMLAPTPLTGSYPVDRRTVRQERRADTPPTSRRNANAGRLIAASNLCPTLPGPRSQKTPHSNSVAEIRRLGPLLSRERITALRISCGVISQQARWPRLFDDSALRINAMTFL